MGLAYLGREEELQRPLLKIKLDEQGHVVAHIERDFTCERCGFGKVGEVFEGECEGDLFLEDDGHSWVVLGRRGFGLLGGLRERSGLNEAFMHP